MSVQQSSLLLCRYRIDDDSGSIVITYGHSLSLLDVCVFVMMVCSMKTGIIVGRDHPLHRPLLQFQRPRRLTDLSGSALEVHWSTRAFLGQL